MSQYVGCDRARTLLEGLIDGELSMADQLAVESHLRWCDTCALRVEDMRTIGASLRVNSASRPLAPVADESLTALTEGVLVRVRAERAQSWQSRVGEMVTDRLLLWPALWGLWIAGDGRPAARILILFVAGVVVTRSAGCVINDYADRDLDPEVARTRDRPLAARRIAPAEALFLFAALGLVALWLALQLDPYAQLFAVAGALLAVTYPWLKRVVHVPQFYLGVAFGWHSLAWEALLELVQRAEAQGFDTVYVDGDVSQLGQRRDVDVLDGWTVTTALLARTSRIRIGSIRLVPDLVNVIAREATLTVDQRNTDDVLLEAADRQLGRFLQELAREESVGIAVRRLVRTPPVKFDERLLRVIEQVAAQLGHADIRRMTSGAGHDAQMMARICPAAMIFVPIIDGISHNPKELTQPEHLEIGANVLLHTLEHLANN